MDAVMTEVAAVITTVVFGLFSFSSSAVDAETMDLDAATDSAVAAKVYSSVFSY